MRRATDLTILLDRSGSMGSVKNSMEEVLNGYVSTQKQEPGECRLTLVKFDDHYEVPFENIPIRQLDEKIIIFPRGATALLDAIGKTIDRTGVRLAALPEYDRPDKVLIVVITDGLENASTEYVSKSPAPAAKRVNDMVHHQREQYKWTFVFLAADQDAIVSAAGIGFGADMSLNWQKTAGGIKGMGSRLNKISSVYRAAPTAAAGAGNIIETCSVGGQNTNQADEQDWDAQMAKANNQANPTTGVVDKQ